MAVAAVDSQPVDHPEQFQAVVDQVVLVVDQVVLVVDHPAVAADRIKINWTSLKKTHRSFKILSIS
jgi:hypothetical protein